jgi:hypothetical protein
MAKDDSAPPNPHRRNFLRGMAAFAAQSAMPLPAWVTDAAKSTNPARGAIVSWLNAHHEFDDFVMQPFANVGKYLLEHPSERVMWTREASAMIGAFCGGSGEAIATNRAYLVSAGQELLAAKPSYEDILSCFRYLADKDTEGAYQTFLGERSIEDAAKELHRISRLSPEEMTLHVEKQMQGLQNAVDKLQTELDSVSPKKKLDSQLPTYRDMAAARKAGGYPVPQQCLGLPSSRVGTHHATSGEWSQRIEASTPDRIIAL